ncbi:MAG TPA: TOMM precursor leader peptide-binding protein [Chroococcales cyanobacterium]|jgi:ribosomal protein S12 methylthiotransferase accessory factor
MLNKPKFKQCFHIEAVEPEAVFLLSERRSFELSQRLFQRLAPLIDSHHTVDEIVEALLPQLLPEKADVKDFISAGVQAFSALVRMEQEGYIVESDDSLPSNLAIFCDTLNIDSREAQRRLQATKVAVKAIGSISTSEFISILESLNIQVSDEGDIEVVLTDTYLQDSLKTINQQALERSHPWMLVKPVGTIVWIGPIFHPRKTGCWQCLAQRLRENRPVEAFIQKRKGIATPLPMPLVSLSSTLQTALGMAATEVLKWILQGENKRLEGILVTHDTLSLETQNHIVVKRPQCPSCGELTNKFNSKPLPIVLGHRKKTFTSDGGHRCFSPEETLRRYQHHISPITGVVREIEKVTQAPNRLTPSYAARHHFVSMFDELDDLRQNLSGRSAGKGKTDIQARASAFCEAIERYSGVFQGDEIRQKGSYQQMGDTAIHPNACMNFSQEQYNNRHEWNANCPSSLMKVPEPFDEEQDIEWTPVWSLTHQDFKYLPTAYCYHGYPKPPKPDCWADSNGCAAGNTLEEAILQGFMELVERDCVALWWYNQVQRPKVNLDSFDEPYFQALNDYYQTLHRELWVLDITSDLNIPTFAAITRRTDREVEDIVLGYGTHFDPKLAILRALTEVNQILPAVLSANADGSTQYLSYEPLAINWWKTATLENQPYLLPDRTVAPKQYADYPQHWSDDLREDVMTCQQIAQKQGMELLVLDQTRPDIGLKVVKVIVPGMRHFWQRLGSGRLYDVPVQLGWLKEPLQENQVNPFPMWM